MITFNFNKKSKRYAYVADVANLQYDLGMQGLGTIMMRAYIDGSAERQYFFENKDSSGHTLGLYRNSENILCVDYNGSTYQTTLSFSSNVWHTVGLSYHEGITSDSFSTTTYLDVRVYLNGQTYSLELGRGFNFGICSTMIGRKKDGINSIYNLGALYNVYPLHGQIEMLATRSAFCELSTLNILAEELKGITKVNQYDELGMLKKIDLHQAGVSILSNTISYKTRDDDGRYLSKQVCQEVFKSPKFTIYREYTTDDLGNITVINDGIFGSHEYAYDYRGFLIEDGSDSYKYDDNGNITAINDIELKYDSPIKDRLTSVDGKAVTYDENHPGNPKTWNGNNYTFEGRRLITYQKGNEEYEYKYNEQGLRIRKTKGTETTNYYYDGDKLITEITPNYRNDFLYDENGLLYGFIHNNVDKYFYVRDTMQNILGIVSQSGELVVKYDYNAYSLPKLTTYTSGKGIGSINPFRYKGYYYDSESNMYYCKSRYYVPDWCRWLNADNPNFLDTESLTDMNLFAYCGNNPVLNIDDSGNSWWSKILIGVGIIATATVIGALIITSGGTAAPLIQAIITGVKTGLTIATVSAVTSGTIRAGRSIAKNVSEGNDFSTTIKNVGKSFLSGFGDGFAAGATYYGTTSLLSMYGCQEFGYFNNGQGYEAPTYTIGYQNPSVAGVTLYASKIGGKFRIDMDPLHSLHYHYGKTNKQRKAHKGSWIGGIVTGIIVGFSGEVY